MKNLGRLYVDELTGFVRSRVMHVLWIGLPLLTVVLRVVQPDTEGMPLLMFVAVLISSIGGTLAAVLLSTTVTNERTNGVYDLFLIRPVTRRTLLMAKFYAAMSSLAIAVLLSLLLGIVSDAVSGQAGEAMLAESIESVVLSLAGMAVACSVGILFGTLFSSMAVSAILAVYVGNQLSALIVLPPMLIEALPPLLFAALTGLIVPALVLEIAVRVFSRATL